MSVSRIMLVAIAEHSRFANARLLDQAALLSDAELDADRPGMFGSIRITLLHMMQAQYSWLRRFQELDPVAPWESAEFQTIADMRRAWAEIDDATLAYLASVTDAQLLEVIHIRFWSGWENHVPRWQAIVHQAFHQQQHRGEMAMVLTTLGHSPGEFDVLDYFDEVS